jgi:2-haloacid dehalogenase
MALQLRDFEALSFDCYGTLIDWEAGIGAVLTEWAARRGLNLDSESLLSAYASHEERAEREHPTALYPEILARTMHELGAELGVEVTDDDAQSLAVSVADWPAFPDSAAALSSLADHYKLIILSNVDRDSFRASNEKLDVEFSSVLTAQDIGSYKPDPHNFEALETEARRLGVAPGALLHVAQSLFHDHAPAKRAGLPTVWINRRHNRSGWGATPAPSAPVLPDWEFPSMSAFAAAAAER